LLTPILGHTKKPGRLWQREAPRGTRTHEKIVEKMRRTLGDMRDVNILDSNEGTMLIDITPTTQGRE
jgi:hypothetical protein